MAERDLIAESKERFERETSEHVMTILLDNDIHRHLRFRKPGTSMYGFEIVTWPGYLAIVGDCGDFVFARIADMFEFFSVDKGINPGYWSEKLQAPRPDGALRYSHEKLVEELREWFKEQDYDMAGVLLGVTGRDALWEAVTRQIIDVSGSGAEAAENLRSFEHKGQRGYFSDAWEWDLREYDWAFLWCCWAISWGIGVYRAQDKNYIARRDVKEYLLTRPEFTGRSSA